MYFFLLFTLLLILCVRYADQLKQTGRVSLTLYQSFRTLTDPNHEHGHFYTIWKLMVMMTTVLQSAYKVHFHDVNLNPEKLNHKFLKIPFRYKDRCYYYLLRIPRGVVPVRSIVDENGMDVTADLEPYLGPNLDGYNSGVTPSDFGYKKLTITTVLDRSAEFGETDVIRLI